LQRASVNQCLTGTRIGELLQVADKQATILRYAQRVGRGQLKKTGIPQSARSSFAEIAAEMQRSFEREIELLKSEGGLTADQLAEYEKLATRIAELFSELAKLK
jgi:hypothetical protein